MEIKADFKGRHAWPAFIAFVIICMLAGAGVTWFIALYTTPRYEQHNKELLDSFGSKETKAMMKWNERQMRKK